MKKVRFQTPTKLVMDTMQEYECHSPRPFIERQFVNNGCNVNQGGPVVFTNDPVRRFENDNSLPYPTANKTYLDMVQKLDKKGPSSDLDLSMLDCSKPRHRMPSPKINTVFRTEPNTIPHNNCIRSDPQILVSDKILNSVENTTTGIHSHNTRHNEFFLKPGDLGKVSLSLMHSQLDRFSISNKNSPHKKKSEVIQMDTHTTSEKENYAPTRVEFDNDCNCHHCIKNFHTTCNITQNNNGNRDHLNRQTPRVHYNMQNCVSMPTKCSCNCKMHIVQHTCNCNTPQHCPLSPHNALDKKPCSPHNAIDKKSCSSHNSIDKNSCSSHNAIDKKTWAIEKYEKTRESESSEIEKSNIVFKEKREPTVSDLFKIIKLQNEQLQLLQEKVDKFISTHNEVQEKQKVPIQNYVTEHLAVQTVNSDQHKISIGVMTSFEMVRTSTMINKEVVKQCEAQIQCNRSQISIKEVVSKKQAGNMNFLEGITPISKNVDQSKEGNAQNCLTLSNSGDCRAHNFIEDKTLNELSLYNVQVDNATTPLMSPEQSLYLDIRDYSESDSGSDDQSNVGWTYYNKVMTHVNGMLEDSDMPSSASALYRHTKQMCLQTDKSNVSVGKRVTFGDDPLRVQQHYIPTPNDTSLKMNQLAAKYLKQAPGSHTPSPKAADEMSFATRKYMETHKLLQGQNGLIQQDIPRFLDITALKQQPKFI